MTTQREEDVGLLLKRIHDGICRGSNNALRPMDLTLSQLRVLSFLARQGDGFTTQKEIEQRFGVSHPTVVGIIQRLESKGMIRCEMDRNDRRVKNILLTSQGRGFDDEMRAHHDAMEKRLTDGLSPEEVSELRRMLNILVRNTNPSEDDAADGREGKNHGR